MKVVLDGKVLREAISSFKFAVFMIFIHELFSPALVGFWHNNGSIKHSFNFTRVQNSHCNSIIGWDTYEMATFLILLRLMLNAPWSPTSHTIELCWGRLSAWVVSYEQMNYWRLTVGVQKYYWQDLLMILLK